MEKIDRIIKEQTETRDQTKQAAAQKQETKLPELAGKQKELAAKTDDLKQTPLPGKEKAEAALEKANQAMDKAAQRCKKRNRPKQSPSKRTP